VLRAEVQATTPIAAVGLTATDITKPTVNLSRAARMVARSRDPIADVALPFLVKAD
jgi:hypothetical protein